MAYVVYIAELQHSTMIHIQSNNVTTHTKTTTVITTITTITQ